MDTIAAKRFKEVREMHGFTQQAFANVLGINNSTVDIERGRTKLSGRVVAILLKKFGVNPLWLYGESEQQYLQIHSGDISPKVISVNSEEQDNILLVNVKASAGYAHNLQDEDWYQELPAFDLPLPEFRNATYRGFQVKGDSMLPNLKPNEWVIGKAVEDFQQVKNNEIYVVVMEDSVLVKRVVKDKDRQQLQLVSINPEYPMIVVNTTTVKELWSVKSKIGFDLEFGNPDLEILQKQIQTGFQQMDKRLASIEK